MDNKPKYTNKAKQMNIYLGKFFRIFIIDKQWFTLVMAAAIAFLVAKVIGYSLFVTMQGTRVGTLAVACVCLWNGMFNSIQAVCKERAIIKREHRYGLSIISYLGAQMIFQAFICAVQCIIMILMLGLCGVHYPAKGLICPIFVIDFFIVLFLITYASDMMGLFVSCLVKTTTLAMTVMPFVLIVQLVFAGVAFPLHGNAKKLSDFTISSWGITALCTQSDYNSLAEATALNKLAELREENEAVDQIVDKIDTDNYLNSYKEQFAPEDKYDYTAKNLLFDCGILLAFIAIFAVLSVVSLSFVDKDKR